MTVKIFELIVIVILASLFWWVVDRLVTVPKLKPILQVVIVVVAVLALLVSLGLISGPTIVVK